ncbi:MAG: MFS transporter, partial [Nitrososphaerales archaeon]
VASAIASTSRQIGQTLGVAVVGALVTSRATAGLVGGDFSSASHAAFWTLAVCGVLVLVLGVVATTRRAYDSARRTAAELNPEALVRATVRGERINSDRA